MKKALLAVTVYVALLACFGAVASQGYVQNGVSVTGPHGNYTTMGMYKGCITCHYVRGTTAVVVHTYTSWVSHSGCQSFNGYTCTQRWYSYTTVDRHKNYTSFFTGFTGGKNPRPGVCLVCHNTASARFSYSSNTTVIRTARSKAVAINSATHTQGTYYNRRDAVRYSPETSAAPLFSYSLGWNTNKTVSKLSPVKNWGTSKVSQKTGFVNTVNNCMDCHQPHSSNKAKYLR